MREKIAVAAPPERVWAVVADPEQDPRWRAGVASVELVSGRPGAAGAVYRERVRAAGALHEAEFEIVDARPHHAVTFAVRRPVRATGGYLLAPRDRGTEIVFHLALPGSRGLRAAGDRLLAVAIGRAARADLERLREIVERA